MSEYLHLEVSKKHMCHNSSRPNRLGRARGTVWSFKVKHFFPSVLTNTGSNTKWYIDESHMFFFHHLNWFNILPRGELAQSGSCLQWLCRVAPFGARFLGIWACAVRQLKESQFEPPLQDDALSNYPSTRPKVRNIMVQCIIMFCMVKDSL